MGGSASEGGLTGTPRDAPPSMTGTDVTTADVNDGVMSGLLLISVGRNGADGEDTGPARSQGWDWGVAQQPSPMGVTSAAIMSAIAAMRLQQQTAVPSQAIRKAAAAWPVRLKISSPMISRHMTGLRLN